MVVNPVLADAMKRAGQEMPEDGLLVMSTGNVIACAASDTAVTVGQSGLSPEQAKKILTELKKVDSAINAIRKVQDPDKNPATAQFRQAYYGLTDGYYGMLGVLGK